MNGRQNGNEQISILNGIEGAIAEKEQQGYASEAHFGFAATMANATPPVDETFRQTLRGRIMAEANASMKPRHTMLFKRWSLSIRGALAAALVLTMLFVVALQIGLRIPGVEDQTPSALPLPQEDIDALASELNTAPTPRTVAVFPADYAPSLAERTQHTVVPLALADPRNLKAIQAALGAVLPRSGLVDVILVDQNGGDVTKLVQAALERQLYRLYRGPGDMGTETFGVLERKQYVAGPTDATLLPIEVRFENGTELVAVGILGELQPGGILRVALDWRAAEAVDDPAVVFVHVLCNGRLIAQRDAVPGNDAFPVPSWEPGEVIRDQFALQLPDDLPAGMCRIQVGMYGTTTGQRYTVTETEAETADGNTAVIIQQLAVKE